MKPSYLLAALAPAMVLADPVPLASLDRVVANLPSNSNPLAHRSPRRINTGHGPAQPTPRGPGRVVHPGETRCATCSSGQQRRQSGPDAVDWHGNWFDLYRSGGRHAGVTRFIKRAF
ncbi:hypothetical protein N7462_004974 [Penicillium macrosclerotiorum]|uniref:uncharacterized protein n=1 Tax=Penicillium macrosclerotiorum TaxID=303699 RepID=UPI0025491AA5|nr:uncharacterized protein N7462_004974 [Penicillium macrosclerotiorum]KAJ5690582.1 hypothetical protein N7462_004974 [Penicillium macrosclerotiorum]